MGRPGRPLGASLAIVASVFVFTLLPLLQVGLVFVVRQHFLNVDYGDNLPQPIMSGGDVLGIPPSTLAFQTILALAFLVVAIFAWRGRPPAARATLIVMVVVYTLIQFASVISQDLAQQNLQFGFSSMDAIMKSASEGNFVTQFLVMLYVIWYMNRGPARAFYRGYYLPTPNPSPNSDDAQP